MSTSKSILRSGSIAAITVAGLALTACASSGGADRYGNVYDYESGQGCNTSPCAAAPVTSTRYGNAGYVEQAPVYAPRTENVVYADCSVINGMNCAPQAPQQMPVYQAQPSVGAYGGYTAQPTQMAQSVACPAGTTPSGDGTCMQNSVSMPGTFGSTTSVPASSYSQSYTSSMTETAPCPAGTTAAGDGTCMQGSNSVSMPGTYGGTTSYDTGSSYSYGSTQSFGGEMAACPSGSTMQGDGTCAMNEGMSTSNVGIEIYSEPVTTTTYGGYTNTGGYVGATDYLPVRK